MIVGLTGGIASGKSTASEILKKFGAEIIDVDMIAREIVVPGTNALVEIERYFGSEVIQENGELDRKLLGSIVFKDGEQLARLNSITHGEIRERTKNVVDTLVKRGERAIIVDAALLFEIELNKLVESVWFIYSKPEIRVERLKARNGFTDLEAKARIGAQSEDLKDFADEVIINEGSVAKLEENLRTLWRKYIGDII